MPNEKIKIAIIGDNFMQSAAFVAALNKLQQPVECRCLDLPFPVEPLIQKSAAPGLEMLAEFQGTEEQVIAHAADAEMLITHLAPVSARVVQSLPGLKFVAVSRGGPVNVDRPALAARNIRLVNTPGRNASAVAEFTLGALIAQTRNICLGHEQLKHGHWRGDLYRADVQRKELSTMTVGVVGYAEIGRKVVRLLRAFGSRILVADPFTELSATDRDYGVLRIELDQLLAEADAVSLHARVPAQACPLLDSAAIAKMKRGAVLINTARGALIDEVALYDALRSGQLSGASLDTFQSEPLTADSPLCGLETVNLTPHIAGASQTTITVAAEMVATETERYLLGQAALNPC